MSEHDLAALAVAYAKHAAYTGSDGVWWRVWRAIERARGHRLGESLATLSPEARRWFARWSFERGRRVEGARAYRAYLADTGGHGPFDPENALYLESLAPAEVAPEAERLLGLTRGDRERTHLALLRARLAAGELDALRARYPMPTGADLHVGEAWARHAIASPNQPALDMCAKLGVSKPTLALLFEVTEISPEAWRERCAPWQPPDGDFAEAWRADPGLRPVPCDGESPHAFGGDLVRMPPCPGCGHTMHAFFVFDVEAEPALRALLPGWRFLPLVGCIDCAAWLVRRDLRVGDDAIELLSGHADGFEAHGEPLARLPRRAAMLRPITDDPGSDRPQVTGMPDWVQDWEAAFCPLCRERMVFVGAMGSTWRMGFEPEITINNGSGYQYHFACAPCRVLAVFGQNT